MSMRGKTAGKGEKIKGNEKKDTSGKKLKYITVTKLIKLKPRKT